MTNVLVTSGEPRIAYTIGKSLAKKGFRVFAGDVKRLSMAGVSRHTAGSMAYAPPSENEEAFLADINRFIQKKNIDVLLPTLIETFTIAKYIQRLTPKARTLLPTYAQIAAIHSKERLTDLAERLGIPVPETWEAADLHAGEQRLSTLPFPVMLKPKHGRGGWGMRMARDAAELVKHMRESSDDLQEYIVQKMIAGDNACACAIYKNGAGVASDSYTYSTVYPLKFGQSTSRESVHCGEAIRSLKKILDHLKWNGVCEMDFLVERDTGKNYLIDANPRFWGAIAQNIAAGVDYPYYYCQLALGNDDFFVGTPVPGTRTRCVGGDMQRVIAEISTAKNKFRLLGQLFQGKKRYAAYDDWDFRDPLPFFVWLFRLLQRGAKKLFARQA